MTSSFLKQHLFRPSGDLHIPFLFFLAALLLSVPLAILLDVPERDVATRYAPMAEEFAAGNWAYAFHPRLPMFHTTVCGILVWLCGISGFTAARIVSVVSFALAVFPLYAVMKRVFDKMIAAGALFVYLVYPYTLRSSASGLREGTKCLLLIMMVHAIFLIREKTNSSTGFLYLCASAGLAMITRSEMILFCGLILWGTMIWETIMRQDMRRNPDGTVPEAANAKPSFVPLFSFAGAFLTDAIVFIPVVVNNAVFGIPTPEVRYLTIFEKIFGHMPSFPEVLLIALFVPFAMALPAMLIVWSIPRKFFKKILLVCAALFVLGYLAAFFREAFAGTTKELNDFLFVLCDTFNWLWSIPALLALVIRFHAGKISFGEKFLFIFIIMHILIITGQNIVYEHTLAFSARYLHPATPLGFGWTSYGLILIAGSIEWGLRRFLSLSLSMRIIMVSLLVFFAFCGLYRDFQPVYKYLFKSRDKAVRRGTFRLAEIFQAKQPVHSRATPPAFSLIYYEGCAVPGVFFERMSKYIVSAYLSGGRVVQDMDLADFYVASPRLKTELADPPGEGWVLLEEIPMGRNEYSLVYCREGTDQ